VRGLGYCLEKAAPPGSPGASAAAANGSAKSSANHTSK
jgi:two-component system, OmpR family, response regulator